MQARTIVLPSNNYSIIFTGEVLTPSVASGSTSANTTNNCVTHEWQNVKSITP